MAKLKGTRTEKNLMTAFAGESQARTRYTYFSGQARKDGFVQIADIFIETAEQEKEHAKRFFKFLEGGEVEVSCAFPAGVIGPTLDNLKAAFAGESQANRRYLYFAQKADVEGYNDVSAVFRSTAEGETGHAHGHLEFMEAVGDPATGQPIGTTELNLKAAIAGETHEYTDMYPGMARTARDEGFAEIADWFETLAKAEKSHAGRFQKALQTLG